MKRLAAALLSLLCLLAFATAARSGEPGCRPYPVTDYSPTGIVGCHVYGEGIASWWPGKVAARNDCEWPWHGCQPITVRSLDTGLTITVVPAMYCDCFSGTPEQRLVDLTLAQVRALGLDPAKGLFRVEVEAAGSLPDTSFRPD